MMISVPNDPLAADESNDGISNNAHEAALPYMQAAADTGCPVCSEANERMRSHDHDPGSAAKESMRPLGVAGREGLLSVIEDLDGLIKSSRRSSAAFRESEGRLAVIEIDMCRGYQRARATLQNLLRADLTTSRRIAERKRPEVDVDCVREVD